MVMLYEQGLRKISIFLANCTTVRFERSLPFWVSQVKEVYAL